MTPQYETNDPVWVLDDAAGYFASYYSTVQAWVSVEVHVTGYGTLQVEARVPLAWLKPREIRS